MDAEDWEDVLSLAEKGAGCDGGHDGYVYEQDRALLEKFRAWLREAEVLS